MKFLIFDSVESTQDEALKLLDNLDSIAVLSLEQTRGRGRKGHTWVSRRGGLYLSIGWKGLPVEDASRLVFSIPVAVVNLLMEVSVRGSIKIPNDILVSGKKICGILIENRNDRTVAGIGLNVNQDEHELLEGATSLFLETGRRFDIIELARKLVDMVQEWKNRDFKEVLREYRKSLMRGSFRFKYRGNEIQDYIIDVDESLNVLGEKGIYRIFWIEDVRV